MGCPRRKELIKEKLKKIEEDKLKNLGKTYAKVAEQVEKVVTLNESSRNTEEIMSETGMRALMMILDAHVQNMIEPGTYNDHLNETMKMNGIKPIKFKTTPKSEKLFKHDIFGKTMTTLQDIQKKVNQRDEEEETDSDGSSTSSSSSSLSARTVIEDEARTETDDILTATELSIGEVPIRTFDHYDVEVFVKASAVKPERDLGPEEVKKLFEEHNLKFRIKKSSKCNRNQIEMFIRNLKLKEEKPCVKFVSTTEFKRRINVEEERPPQLEAVKPKRKCAQKE
jgi:hypothetical protein